MLQITGEGEVDNKGTGDSKDPHKDELPKVQETTTHVSTVARSDTSPKIVPRDEGLKLDPI